jgi:site-specific DNA-methyltransferase (adenine-specific)
MATVSPPSDDSPANASAAKNRPETDAARKLLNRVHCGDSLAVLRKLPDDLVDCVVTSPPYYQQRDYHGQKKQVGREDSPAEYVQRLQTLFGEVRRTLKASGTLWLVIGDKYENGAQLGLPWRVALALVDEGWILRSDCIWHKPNAMPSSTKNRPTTDHEYIFLLTKSADYHYDADAIREPHVTFSENSKMKGGRRHFGKRGGTPEVGKNGGDTNLHNGRWDQAFHPLGRNKRTVWSIPLSKFRGAHFAVFPESLVRTCLLAGCPPQGVVLDPFLGSGTTALVAQELGHSYIGIDVAPEYCKIARERLKQTRLF